MVIGRALTRGNGASSTSTMVWNKGGCEYQRCQCMPYDSTPWDQADRMSGSDGTETHNGLVALPCIIDPGVGIFLQYLPDFRSIGELSIDRRITCSLTALETCKVVTAVVRYTSIQIHHTYTFEASTPSRQLVVVQDGTHNCVSFCNLNADRPNDVLAPR